MVKDLIVELIMQSSSQEHAIGSYLETVHNFTT